MPSESSNDTSTWRQTRSYVGDQLESLQTVADDLARSRTIDTDERVEAVQIATHLAESLAGFGFDNAAVLAHDVLTTLQHPGLPQPERLQQQLLALRGVLAPALEEEPAA